MHLYFKVLSECIQVANKIYITQESVGKKNLMWNSVLIVYHKPLVSSTDICVKIKQFSRRLKAWRNITWEDSTDGRPSSYLLVILVVIAFDTLPDDKKMITKGGMNKIVPL